MKTLADLWAPLLCALVLLVCGFVLGMRWQSGRDTQALAASRTDTANALAQAAVTQSALDTVSAQSAARLAELRNQQAVAASVLTARNAAVPHIAQQAVTRQRAVEQTIHETDCQLLGTLPVCPAVAHRLWGEDASADPPASGAGAR